jgi:hypothetical protein
VILAGSLARLVGESICEPEKRGDGGRRIGSSSGLLQQWHTERGAGCVPAHGHDHEKPLSGPSRSENLHEHVDVLADEFHGPFPGRKVRIGQEAESVLPPALGVSPFDGRRQIAGLSGHIPDSSRSKAGLQDLVHEIRNGHIVRVQPGIDVPGARLSGSHCISEEARRHETEAFPVLGDEIAVFLQEWEIARFRESREEILCQASGKRSPGPRAQSQRINEVSRYVGEVGGRRSRVPSGQRFADQGGIHLPTQAILFAGRANAVEKPVGAAL